MTDVPQYTFELKLDTNPAAPRLTVVDRTNLDQVTSAMDLPKGGPPYTLVVGPAPNSAATLAITPQTSAAPAFDAAVTSGRSVLQFSASIPDKRLTTRDDTRYVISLKNLSQYYVAENIRVSLSLVAPALPRLPDGNETIMMIPNEQHVRCIEPGGLHEVAFVVITRGVKPGKYPIHVNLTYRIVYWDGRDTSTTYAQVLTIHE